MLWRLCPHNRADLRAARLRLNAIDRPRLTHEPGCPGSTDVFGFFGHGRRCLLRSSVRPPARSGPTPAIGPVPSLDEGDPLALNPRPAHRGPGPVSSRHRPTGRRRGRGPGQPADALDAASGRNRTVESTAEPDPAATGITSPVRGVTLTSTERTPRRSPDARHRSTAPASNRTAQPAAQILPRGIVRDDTAHRRGGPGPPWPTRSRPPNR